MTLFTRQRSSCLTALDVAAAAVLCGLLAAAGCAKDKPARHPTGSREKAEDPGKKLDSDPPPAAAPTAATSTGAAVPEAPHPLFQTERIVQLKVLLDDEARASLKHRKRKLTRATIELDGERIANVGIRLKGHRSMRELDEGPSSFVLDFQSHATGRLVHGLRRLVVNAMVEDETRLRETLGYQLYRRLGVPAPRTGYATVTLDGQKPRVALLVEPIDEQLLAKQTGDGSGNLYEGEYGCDVRASDVWRLDKDAGTDRGRRALHKLAAAMPAGVTVVFADRPGMLDADEVLRYLAMSALVGDFDGYWHHHNYYLYHHPRRDRFLMLPWGLDRVLYDKLDVYQSEGLLARMCTTDAACRLRYIAAMNRALQVFEAADLPAQVSRLEALVGPGEERDELRKFVRERPAMVRKQIDCLAAGKELDRDGDGYGCMDCDDADPQTYPGAPEKCDGLDNDCSGIDDDAPHCPCEKTEIDGYAFEFCVYELDWPSAAKMCEAKGMWLAWIDNRKQNDAVHHFGGKIDELRWWLGLNDRGQEDRFVWHGGSKSDFTRFKRGEPDDDDCGEDCVSLGRSPGGKWYDANCSSSRPFICRSRAPVSKPVNK